VDRLLLITPARDEAEHLQATIDSVAAQTRPPDLWLIVDDGSTDATPRIAARAAAEHSFVRALAAPARPERGGDGLAIAAEARAFNATLADVDLARFTHVGKLDGDVELPPPYFERLLGHFAAEPGLGIAGGQLLEDHGRGWRPTSIPPHHVRGAVKLYSRECFVAIGGIEEMLGWDTIDEVRARMHGWSTRSLPGVDARHHRPVATRAGALRGRARHGQTAYILRYGAWWVGLKSLKVSLARPYGLTGLAFLYGYARAVARREPRVEDERFRRFVAAELRRRVRPSAVVQAAPGDPRGGAKVPTNIGRS